MKCASILPFHFLMMTIFGIWCPVNWSPIKKNLHYVYKLFVIALMFSLVGLQLSRLIFVKLTLDEFNDTFYVSIATGVACFKFASFVAHNDQVSQLIDMFQIDCCLGRDDFERNLKRKYDRTCATIGKASLMFVETELMAFIVAPLSRGIESRKLPYEALQVYDMSNPFIYALSYLHHAYAGILYGGINIVTDSIIAAFMMQLCAQIDVMSHRLIDFPAQARHLYSHGNAAIVETCLLKNYIEHHIHIYKIADSIMSTFNDIVVAQFYASTLQICLSVYQLTFRVSNTIDLINHGFFLICMLLQPGMYCYFGNKLTDKSVNLRDAIYNMNWISLTNDTKKNLAFMICRTSLPIEITDGAFVRLTMQTFASIVKLAYSAFSVIKSSR